MRRDGSQCRGNSHVWHTPHGQQAATATLEAVQGVLARKHSRHERMLLSMLAPVSHGMTCAPPPTASVKMSVSFRLSRIVFTKAIRKNSVAIGMNVRHMPWRDWSTSPSACWMLSPTLLPSSLPGSGSRADCACRQTDRVPVAAWVGPQPLGNNRSACLSARWNVPCLQQAPEHVAQLQRVHAQVRQQPRSTDDMLHAGIAARAGLVSDARFLSEETTQLSCARGPVASSKVRAQTAPCK
jgi:hypothetical protein